MILTALSALLSHWHRHPIQLTTLVIGLALATSLWSAVQAINSEARSSYDRAALQLGMKQQSFLESDFPIKVEQYVALKKAGWRLSPVLEGKWRIGGQSLDLVGIELLNHPDIPALVSTNASSNELEPTPTNSLFLEMLRPPGLVLMHPITKAGLRDDTDRPPVLATVDVPQGTAITDIALAANLLRSQDQISRILVLSEQPADLTSLEVLAPNLRLVTFADGANFDQLTNSFHLNLTAFGFLSFAVGLFIVQGTIALALEQRRPLFRTLRCLGVPLTTLTALVGIELLLISFFSGLLGLSLGYLLASLLLPGVQATLDGLYGAEIPGFLTFRPLWAISALAMVLLGTLLAGSHSILSLWRMPLSRSPTGKARSQSAIKDYQVTTVLGLCLGIAGLALFPLLGGLLGGFVLLGGVMMGSALILPALLDQVLRRAQTYSRSALAEWLWADSRSLLPGLSLALMALLLAVATNIGVGTMVSSFRLTFTGWLDQRLASQIYVTFQNDEQGRAFVNWTETNDLITALPIRWTNDSHLNSPVRVYGIVDDRIYRDHWPLLSADVDIWTNLFETDGALVNEQLFYRAKLSIGDSFSLGSGKNLNILGTYSDYGNPNGQIIVSMATLTQIDDQTPYNRFGLRVPEDKIQDVTTLIRNVFSLNSQDVIDQSSLKKKSLSIFESTFVITQALNILTLGVASFAILTSLLTLWNQRLPQLAPIWAMGLTRGALAMFEILRSVLLAVLTALMALPLGLILAWVLLTVINVEAFGWRLPMFLFPVDWLRLFFFALISAVVAACLPALKLLTISPAHLLRFFANER